MIQVTIPGTPIGKGRPRLGRNATYTPQKTRSWTNSCQWHMRKGYKGSPLTGPLRVSLFVVFPLPKSEYRKRTLVKRRLHTSIPDVDNVEKIVYDAGNGILWHDDCLIAVNHTTMIVGAQGEEPRIEITVEQLEDENA